MAQAASGIETGSKGRVVWTGTVKDVGGRGNLSVTWNDEQIEPGGDNQEKEQSEKQVSFF